MKIDARPDEMVNAAFGLLKQSAYYDKTDLFLRARIAAYENSPDFVTRQKRIIEVVSALRRAAGDKCAETQLDTWLSEIDFHMLPKKVSMGAPGEPQSGAPSGAPKLISNIRTATQYQIGEGALQYLISAPVEIHVLDTLWCMLTGCDLDSTLDDCCYGNRIDPSAATLQGSSSKLFKIFHVQYGKWRDQAIECAGRLLDAGLSIAIISMDVKKCFYNMTVDWGAIRSRLQSTWAPHVRLSRGLLNLLEAVHDKYHDIVHEYLRETHGLGNSMPRGLPVGLNSSRVLANWILAPFDREVFQKLQPPYYGRYVDDMLIVAPFSAASKQNIGPHTIVNSLLADRRIISLSDDGQEYRLCCPQALSIQSEKLLVHYFDKNHSRAGLKEFIDAIRQSASDMRFLPADERGRELDACAYDILYEGSINKLRSVIGVKENSTELSRYLSRRMIEHRLTSEPLSGTIADQIEKFGQGTNLLNFCEAWEGMLTLLVAKCQHDRAASMLDRCTRAVNRLASRDGSKPSWVQKVRSDTQIYLHIACAMALALLGDQPRSAVRSKQLNKWLDQAGSDAIKFAGDLRRSNLMRHHWTAWPLLNFTSYSGSLVDLDMAELRKMGDWNIERALSLSPRYVHDDEKKLFDLLHAMMSDGELAYDHFSKELGIAPAADGAVSGADAGSPHIAETQVAGELAEQLNIGIANLRVNERDIVASIDPKQSPNRTWERQATLFQLLNQAELEHCDMLVLPEVSVPYSWVPFMVGHARQTQMALVFGSEHWTSGPMAANLLFTILPYRSKGGYKSCHVFVRPKNYYSPKEVEEIARLGLRPLTVHPGYHVFDWRGVRFAVFNCFELTNIRHRAAMGGDVDLVIAVEWNPDTGYFSNIIGSTVRDLHCYAVQVNTSQYGDSRVTAPKRAEEMNLAQISGGENATLLKATIDLAELNHFRRRLTSPVDKRFKPLPAGFEHSRIRNRRAEE